MKNLFSNLVSASSPLINLYILILLFSQNLVTAVDQRFQNCSVPRSCGNHRISFPFYIQGLQHSYCGFPGFQLSCDHIKGRPILNLSGEDYVVHEIFYQNQSLIVSNAAFWAPDQGCTIPPVRNLSLPREFVLTSNESGVLLLYTCRTSSLDRTLLKYKIGCSKENDTKSVLALYENDDNNELIASASRTCGTGRRAAAASAPVGTSERGGMKEVLRSGFMVNWRASSCGLCSSSGGICGFNHSNYHFKCFCPDRPHSAKCDTHISGISGATKAAIAIATTIAGVGSLVLLILRRLRKKSYRALIFFWKKQNQTSQKIETFLRNYEPLQVRRYSYSNVKKMTNSFKEKLGQGGFGTVYKGKLDHGSLVAVKVLNQSKGDDGQDFINEVATISTTSHVNIVTLLGFCFEGAKKALIYEFMSNGSLEKFVFEENATKNGDQLDWETQYQISLGIARGLEYLHRGCNTRILHFDIKPHNILLDANFVPKISDFGLAKICTKKESLVSLSDLRGTIGYIAPEVFSRSFGEVSHKSDVYSYGMMVLEMVGGRKNVNVRIADTSEVYFPHWIYKRLELDEELGLKRITNEEDRMKVRKMTIVSLWCIQTDPSSRPTMSKVVEMLQGSLGSLPLPPEPFLSTL